MWFKKYSEHKELIKPTDEVRPYLKSHYERLKRPIVSKPEFSMIHYRYLVPLNEIYPDSKLPTKPASFWVLESDKKEARAFHKLSLNKKKPELLETILSKVYIDNFKLAILKLKELEPDETESEIRQLSILALNIDAVWLHYESNIKEIIYFRKIGAKEFEVNDEKEFFFFLNEQKLLLGKMEDEMGA